MRLKLVGTWLQYLTQASVTSIRDAELDTDCYVTFLLRSYIILTFPLRVYSISNSFLCLVYERGQFIFFPYGYQIVPSFFQEDFLSPLNRIDTLVETSGLYKYGSSS